MNKVALVIIYNHLFNKNIDILENIYRSRFSNIYHLVPFYTGEKTNVIPVYENSYYFSGYVSQSCKNIFKENFHHYFFIADDLILNPIINETNYTEHLKLESNTCFLPGFINLHDSQGGWKRVKEALHWNINLSGVEASKQLPDYEQALKQFHNHGLEIKPLRFNQIWKVQASLKEYARMFLSNPLSIISFIIRKFSSRFITKKYHIPYPIISGYSDIFIVSSDAFKQFCHYCGVFAATNLFVELAIPTALVLSSKKLVTEKDIALQGKALWTKNEFKELDQYKNSLKDLLEYFPAKYLFLHPIKLSKWC